MEKLTACKDCEHVYPYYMWSRCKKHEKTKAFNSFTGEYEYKYGAQNRYELCENINKGHCKDFEEK